MEDLKKRLVDRFEGFELIDLLNISIEDVVEAFEETITDNIDFLEEYLAHGH
jgi:hypothetical protein